MKNTEGTTTTEAATVAEQGAQGAPEKTAANKAAKPEEGRAQRVVQPPRVLTPRLALRKKKRSFAQPCFPPKAFIVRSSKHLAATWISFPDRGSRQLADMRLCDHVDKTFRQAAKHVQVWI
jgi:hypothetical protein